MVQPLANSGGPREHHRSVDSYADAAGLYSNTLDTDFGAYFAKHTLLRKFFELGTLVRATCPPAPFTFIMACLFKLGFACFLQYRADDQIPSVFFEVLGGIFEGILGITIIATISFWFQTQRTGRPGEFTIKGLSYLVQLQDTVLYGQYMLLLFFMNPTQSASGFTHPLSSFLLVHLVCLFSFWLPLFRFFCADVCVVFPKINSSSSNLVSIGGLFLDFLLILAHMICYMLESTAFSIISPIIVALFILVMLRFVPYKLFFGNAIFVIPYIFIAISAVFDVAYHSRAGWVWVLVSVGISLLFLAALVVQYRRRIWIFHPARLQNRVRSSVERSAVVPRRATLSEEPSSADEIGIAVPTTPFSPGTPGGSAVPLVRRSLMYNSVRRASSVAVLKSLPTQSDDPLETPQVPYPLSHPDDYAKFLSLMNRCGNATNCELLLRSVCEQVELNAEKHRGDKSQFFLPGEDIHRLLVLFSKSLSTFRFSKLLSTHFCLLVYGSRFSDVPMDEYNQKMTQVLSKEFQTTSHSVMSWPFLYELFAVRMLQSDSTICVHGLIWTEKDILDVVSKIDGIRKRIIQQMALFWKEVTLASAPLQKTMTKFVEMENQVQEDAERRRLILATVLKLKDRGKVLLRTIERAAPSYYEVMTCRCRWLSSVEFEVDLAQKLARDADSLPRLVIPRPQTGAMSMANGGSPSGSPMHRNQSMSSATPVHRDRQLSMSTAGNDLASFVTVGGVALDLNNSNSAPHHLPRDRRPSLDFSVDGSVAMASDNHVRERHLMELRYLVLHNRLHSLRNVRIVLAVTFLLMCLFVIVYFALCRQFILQPISSGIADRDFRENSDSGSKTQSRSDKARAVTLPFEIVSRIRRSVSKWASLSRFFVTKDMLPKNETIVKMLGRHAVDVADRTFQMHRQLRDSEVTVFYNDIWDAISNDLSMLSVQNFSIPAGASSMIPYYGKQPVVLSNAAVMDSFIATLNFVSSCMSDPIAQRDYLNNPNNTIFIGTLGYCSGGLVSLWYNGLTGYLTAIQKIQEAYQSATEAYLNKVWIILLSISVSFVALCGLCFFIFIWPSIRKHHMETAQMLAILSTMDGNMLKEKHSELTHIASGVHADHKDHVAEVIRGRGGTYISTNTRGTAADTAAVSLHARPRSPPVTDGKSVFRSRLVLIMIGILFCICYTQIFTSLLAVSISDSVHAMYQTRYLTNCEGLLWKSMSFGGELMKEAVPSAQFSDAAAISVQSAEDGMSEYYSLVDGSQGRSPGLIQLTPALKDTILTAYSASEFPVEYPDTLGNSLAMDMANLFTEVVSLATSVFGSVPSSFFWSRLAQRYFGWMPAKLDKVFEELLYYYTRRTDLYRSLAEGFFGAAFVLFPFVFIVFIWKSVTEMHREEMFIRRIFATLSLESILSSDHVLLFMQQNTFRSMKDLTSSYFVDLSESERDLDDVSTLERGTDDKGFRARCFLKLDPIPFIEVRWPFWRPGFNASSLSQFPPIVSFANQAACRLFRLNEFALLNKTLEELFVEETEDDKKRLTTFICNPSTRIEGEMMNFKLNAVAVGREHPIKCSVTVELCTLPSTSDDLSSAWRSSFGFYIVDRTEELRQHDRLEREQQRTNEIIDNFVPKAVGDRLRPKAEVDSKDDGIIAFVHNDLTCIFQDIVGFTPLCTELSRGGPSHVISLLHVLYSEFDKAAEKRGIVKIKILGDGSMWVSGLNFPNESKPENVVDPAEAARNAVLFGQDMIRIAASVGKSTVSVGRPLEVRVGIHTGVVTSGVISRSRVLFDIFGQDVNKTARMESSGVPGTVHLSEETYRLVSRYFRCEQLDPMHLKGLGNQKFITYSVSPDDPGTDTTASTNSTVSSFKPSAHRRRSMVSMETPQIDVTSADDFDTMSPTDTSEHQDDAENEL
eukprot:ANDGO_00014.mRNA.1 Adenylate cyclase